jgi:hypothetical protein
MDSPRQLKTVDFARASRGQNQLFKTLQKPKRSKKRVAHFSRDTLLLVHVQVISMTQSGRAA